MKLLAKYTHPTAGYTPENTRNPQLLVLNQIYEVNEVNMGQSLTHITLKEFPGKVFNSVSFDFYHDIEQINLVDFPEYNPYYTKDDCDEE